MTKYNFNENLGYLEIDPQFIEEGIEYAEKEVFNSIRIRTLNRNSGEKYDINFSSFQEKKNIKNLIINDDFKLGRVQSAESLYTLNELRHLQIMQSMNLDLSNLQQLESLYLKYDKKFTNLNSLVNIKKLLLSALKEKDLNFLNDLKNIEEFRLSGSIESLKGIEKMSKLKYLKMSYCSKLVDIKQLNTLPLLEVLNIEKCKQLTDFSFLSGNSSIRELFIDNLDSIQFVSSMPNIEKINFWLSKDGDMTPLIKSKSLKQINFYPNKKHYNHTIEEIIETTGAQRGRNK